MKIDMFEKPLLLFGAVIAFPAPAMVFLVGMVSTHIGWSNTFFWLMCSVMAWILVFMPYLSIGQLFLPWYLARKGYVNPQPRKRVRRYSSSQKYNQEEYNH